MDRHSEKASAEGRAEGASTYLGQLLEQLQSLCSSPETSPASQLQPNPAAGGADGDSIRKVLLSFHNAALSPGLPSYPLSLFRIFLLFNHRILAAACTRTQLSRRMRDTGWSVVG